MKYLVPILLLLVSYSNERTNKEIIELGNSINDTILPQSLIQKIQKSGSNNQVTKEIITALQIAANKY